MSCSILPDDMGYSCLSSFNQCAGCPYRIQQPKQGSALSSGKSKAKKSEKKSSGALSGATAASLLIGGMVVTGLLSDGDWVPSGTVSQEEASKQALPYIREVSFTDDNGGHYSGWVKGNNVHGSGVYVWADGRRYEGNWNEGLLHGQGEFTSANGKRVYKGTFVNGEMTGMATLRVDGVYQYEGAFLNGQFHGQGKITFSDGGWYNGEWLRGERNGKGTMVWGNGDSWSGVWEKGIPSRGGVRYMTSGDVCTTTDLGFVYKWSDGLIYEENADLSFFFHLPNGLVYQGIREENASEGAGGNYGEPPTNVTWVVLPFDEGGDFTDKQSAVRAEIFYLDGESCDWFPYKRYSGEVTYSDGILYPDGEGVFFTKDVKVDGAWSMGEFPDNDQYLNEFWRPLASER